jgi:hypothetical protein
VARPFSSRVMTAGAMGGGGPKIWTVPLEAFGSSPETIPEPMHEATVAKKRNSDGMSRPRELTMFGSKTDLSAPVKIMNWPLPRKIILPF